MAKRALDGSREPFKRQKTKFQLSDVKSILEFNELNDMLARSKDFASVGNLCHNYLNTKRMYIDSIDSNTREKVKDFLCEEYSLSRSLSAFDIQFDPDDFDYNLNCLSDPSIDVQSEVRMMKGLCDVAKCIVRLYRRLALPPKGEKLVQSLETNLKTIQSFFNILKEAIAWFDRLEGYPTAFHSGVGILRQTKKLKGAFPLILKLERRKEGFQSLLYNYFAVHLTFTRPKERLSAASELLDFKDFKYPALRQLLEKVKNTERSLDGCATGGVLLNEETKVVCKKVETLAQIKSVESAHWQTTLETMFLDPTASPCVIPLNEFMDLKMCTLMYQYQHLSWPKRIKFVSDCEIPEFKASANVIGRIKQLALDEEILPNSLDLLRKKPEGWEVKFNEYRASLTECFQNYDFTPDQREKIREIVKPPEVPEITFTNPVRIDLGANLLEYEDPDPELSSQLETALAFQLKRELDKGLAEFEKKVESYFSAAFQIVYPSQKIVFKAEEGEGLPPILQPIYEEFCSLVNLKLKEERLVERFNQVVKMCEDMIASLGRQLNVKKNADVDAFNLNVPILESELSVIFTTCNYHHTLTALKDLKTEVVCTKKLQILLDFEKKGYKLFEDAQKELKNLLTKSEGAQTKFMETFDTIATEVRRSLDTGKKATRCISFFTGLTRSQKVFLSEQVTFKDLSFYTQRHIQDKIEKILLSLEAAEAKVFETTESLSLYLNRGSDEVMPLIEILNSDGSVHLKYFYSVLDQLPFYEAATDDASISRLINLCKEGHINFRKEKKRSDIQARLKMLQSQFSGNCHESYDAQKNNISVCHEECKKLLEDECVDDFISKPINAFMTELRTASSKLEAEYELHEKKQRVLAGLKDMEKDMEREVKILLNNHESANDLHTLSDAFEECKKRWHNFKTVNFEFVRNDTKMESLIKRAEIAKIKAKDRISSTEEALRKHIKTVNGTFQTHLQGLKDFFELDLDNLKPKQIKSHTEKLEEFVDFYEKNRSHLSSVVNLNAEVYVAHLNDYFMKMLHEIDLSAFQDEGFLTATLLATKLYSFYPLDVQVLQLLNQPASESLLKVYKVTEDDPRRDLYNKRHGQYTQLVHNQKLDADIKRTLGDYKSEVEDVITRIMTCKLSVSLTDFTKALTLSSVIESDLDRLKKNLSLLRSQSVIEDTTKEIDILLQTIFDNEISRRYVNDKKLDHEKNVQIENEKRRIKQFTDSGEWLLNNFKSDYRIPSESPQYKLFISYQVSTLIEIIAYRKEFERELCKRNWPLKQVQGKAAQLSDQIKNENIPEQHSLNLDISELLVNVSQFLEPFNLLIDWLREFQALCKYIITIGNMLVMPDASYSLPPKGLRNCCGLNDAITNYMNKVEKRKKTDKFKHRFDTIFDSATDELDQINPSQIIHNMEKKLNEMMSQKNIIPDTIFTLPKPQFNIQTTHIGPLRNLLSDQIDLDKDTARIYSKKLENLEMDLDKTFKEYQRAITEARSHFVHAIGKHNIDIEESRQATLKKKVSAIFKRCLPQEPINLPMSVEMKKKLTSHSLDDVMTAMKTYSENPFSNMENKGDAMRFLDEFHKKLEIQFPHLKKKPAFMEMKDIIRREKSKLQQTFENAEGLIKEFFQLLALPANDALLERFTKFKDTRTSIYRALYPNIPFFTTLCSLVEHFIKKTKRECDISKEYRFISGLKKNYHITFWSKNETLQKVKKCLTVDKEQLKECKIKLRKLESDIIQVNVPVSSSKLEDHFLAQFNTSYNQESTSFDYHPLVEEAEKRLRLLETIVDMGILEYETTMKIYYKGEGVRGTEDHLETIKQICEQRPRSTITPTELWGAIIDNVEGKNVSFSPLKVDRLFCGLFDQSPTFPRPHHLTSDGIERRLHATEYCPCPFTLLSPLWHKLTSLDIFCNRESGPRYRPGMPTDISTALKSLQRLKQHPRNTELEIIVLNIVLYLNIKSDYPLTEEISDICDKDLERMVELSLHFFEGKLSARNIILATDKALQISTDLDYISLDDEHLIQSPNIVCNWKKLVTLLEHIYEKDLSQLLSSLECIHHVSTNKPKSLNAYALFRLQTKIDADLWKCWGIMDRSLKDHFSSAYPVHWKNRLPFSMFDLINVCLIFQIECTICTKIAERTWRVLKRVSPPNDKRERTTLLDRVPEKIKPDLSHFFLSFDKDLVWMLHPKSHLNLTRPVGVIIDIMYQDDNRIDIVNFYSEQPKSAEMPINTSQLKTLTSACLSQSNRDSLYPLNKPMYEYLAQMENASSQDDAISQEGDIGEDFEEGDIGEDFEEGDIGEAFEEGDIDEAFEEGDIGEDFEEGDIGEDFEEGDIGEDFEGNGENIQEDEENIQGDEKNIQRNQENIQGDEKNIQRNQENIQGNVTNVQQIDAGNISLEPSIENQEDDNYEDIQYLLDTMQRLLRIA